MSQQKHKTDNTSIVQRRRQSLTVNHHPRNDQRTIRSHTSGQSEPGRKMLKADVTRLKKCSKLTSRPSVGGGKGKDGREDVVRPKEHSQLTSRTQTQNRVATSTAKGFLIPKSGHHKPSRLVVDFRGARKKKVMYATHTVQLDWHCLHALRVDAASSVSQSYLESCEIWTTLKIVKWINT